jgi:hypothetical protein
MIRASSYTVMPRASAFEAKVERRCEQVESLQSVCRQRHLAERARRLRTAHGEDALRAVDVTSLDASSLGGP